MHAHASPPGGRAPERPRYDVADIVRAHGQAFLDAHVVTPEQHAVLRDVARCRTAALGGHAEVCTACGTQALAYNSCRNRHCPKCQSLAQARWVAQRRERMLPTHCFHVVFTLPRELRALTLANRETVFDLLFAASAQALLELGRTPKWLGADLGLTSVLHTWRRDLHFHPHIHCIVTGGGLSPDGQRWVDARPDFLFPVRVLGALFRGKLLAALCRAHDRGELRFAGAAAPLQDRRCFARLCDKLRALRWVVYCKPPFGTRDQVFAYLGRYTHRVGLSNGRLLAVDDHAITFRTRGDGRVTVPPDEFLRRFLLHVLPKGFVKIRHHGLFAASHVPTKLSAARALLFTDRSGTAMANAAPVRAPNDFRDLLLALTGLDLRCCRHCGASTVVRLPLAPPSLGRDAGGVPLP